MARKKGPRTKANIQIPYEVIPREPYVLSGQQEQAINFLAQHGYRPGQGSKSGVLKACYELLGIGRTTLYEWLGIPEFQTKLSKRVIECHDQVMQGAAVAMREGNSTVILRFLDVFYPEIWDKKMELAKLKHKHQVAIVRLQAELKLNPEEDEDFEVTFEETAEGARLDTPVDEEDA